MEFYSIKQVITKKKKKKNSSKGYWRSNRLQKAFIKCLPYSESCLKMSNDMNEICDEAYIGPLCQTCKINFAKFGGSLCMHCPNTEINILFTIIIALLIIAFLSLYIK